MNRRSSTTVIGLALAAMLIASSVAAAQPAEGFATYKVSLSSPMGQRSLLLNESSSPSNRAGFSDLVLQLIGTQQNLTYSRLVNASEDFLPYLPSLAPQSLNYKGASYSLQLNVTAPGTADLTFGGNQYTMSVLAMSVAGSYGNRSIEANGTVETFPSSLVYSVSVVSGFVRVVVTLQATDLPLTSPDSQVSSTAYVGAGVGIGAAALGGAFLISRKERKAKQPEEKPLHWVD